MDNMGRAMTRQQLLDAAFAGDFDGFHRTIDVHIRRLRRKVEADPANPRHIVTVYGLGYKFLE
jgi:DNA-binding response OmpR family regulator